MLNKKLLVILLGILLLSGGVLTFYLLKEHGKEIETLSAKLQMELEDVEANTEGIIKTYKIESFSSVKMGDVIAEISKTASPQTNCRPDAVPAQLTEDYKDSAIMYKDGVITKEEYDASLAKYKTQKNKICTNSTSTVEPVYAEQDGIFIQDDDYNVGSKVKEESILGVIRPEAVIVKAYFSPKDVKRLKVGKNAQVTIVKYPEKPLTGVVKSIDKIDINGQAVNIEITEDTSNFNIADEDAAIVKIIK